MDIARWQVQRAVDGDEVALCQIFSQVEPFVRDFVKSHVDDPNDVDDVCQEIYVQILKGLKNYLHASVPFENWVSGIVWQYINRYRKSGWECTDIKKKRFDMISLDEMEDATW